MAPQKHGYSAAPELRVASGVLAQVDVEVRNLHAARAHDCQHAQRRHRRAYVRHELWRAVDLAEDEPDAPIPDDLVRQHHVGDDKWVKVFEHGHVADAANDGRDGARKERAEPVTGRQKAEQACSAQKHLCRPG